MSQQTHQTAFFIYEFRSRLTRDAGVQDLNIFDCPITRIRTLATDVIHDTGSGFVTCRELVSNGTMAPRDLIGPIGRAYYAVWLWATIISIRDRNANSSTIQSSCSWEVVLTDGIESIWKMNAHRLHIWSEGVSKTSLIMKLQCVTYYADCCPSPNGILGTKQQNLNLSRLVLQLCCLCSTHWSRVLGWEQRCIWSSADRRCSNYICLINNFIAYQGVHYIRGLTVVHVALLYKCIRLHHYIMFYIRIAASHYNV